MKLVLLLVFSTICIGCFSQNDSLVITRVSDNFIQIKSLRHKLFDDNSEGGTIETSENGFVYVRQSYLPESPVLKDGTVLMVDRQNTPLAMYIYADSSLVQEDHYKNGRIYRQGFSNYQDSLYIDKYYWNNGNLKHLIYSKGGRKKVYDYSIDGRLLEPKK